MKKKSKKLASINELRKMAQEHGLLSNPLFETTLTRYETQIQVLENLQEIINTSPTIIDKVMSSGKTTPATHPAITDYNRTTDSANKTVGILLKVIQEFKTKPQEEEDPLLEAINSGDGDGE